MTGLLGCSPLASKNTPSLQALQEKFFATKNGPLPSNLTLDSYNQYVIPLYKAIFLYSHTIRTAIERDLNSYSGSVLAEIAKEISFEVLGDTFKLTKTLDHEQGRGITNWIAGSTEVVGRFSHDTGLLIHKRILWPGNSTEIPITMPFECNKGEQLTTVDGRPGCITCSEDFF